MKTSASKTFFPEEASISEENMNYSNKSNKPNIMVIAPPFTSVHGQAALTSLIDMLSPISKEIFITTEGTFSYAFNKKIHIVHIKSTYQKGSMFIWAFKQILIQLRVCINILKIYKNIDVFIFYLAARSYLLPMLCAKLLKKKTVVTATGSASKGAKAAYCKLIIGKWVLPPIVGFFEKINFSLSDQIIVESESAVNFLGLDRYRKKISIAYTRIIDRNNFKIKKNLKDKRNLIGYIGRISSEKGVTNFTKAIPLILKERNDSDFLIGGDGPLFDEIKNALKMDGVYAKATFTGWIPHNKVPDYLNKLKLLVLPSYTEGLPGIVLEAMACGTLVLATPVGGVPDIIKDGETGFIMENNSPECIAENVERALNSPDLDEIVKRARELVEKEFTYEAAVERYKKILENI